VSGALIADEVHDQGSLDDHLLAGIEGLVLGWKEYSFLDGRVN
jgi:hypothetical protein